KEAITSAGAGGIHPLAAYITGLWLGNVILMLFNLVPAFPMDGGRVLRALLGMGMSHLRATEVAANIGLFAAACLALVGLLWKFSLVFVAIFVAFAGQRELAALRQREFQRRQELFEPLVAEPVVVEPAPHRPLEGFTGLIYDRDNRVWVW